MNTHIRGQARWQTQFLFGWQRLTKEGLTIDTLYVGPFNLSLYRIPGEPDGTS